MAAPRVALLVLFTACGAPGAATPDAAVGIDGAGADDDAAPGVDAMAGADAAVAGDAVVNVDAAIACTPGAWTTETIDATGDVGQRHDLARDASGRLHVAYWDKTNGDLKYALRSASGTWTTMVVDAANNVGGSLSITVDAAGDPHIAYLDQTNVDLKYATRVGTGGWSIGVIDNGTSVGLSPQIIMDAAGTLHVTHVTTDNLGSSSTGYAYKPAGGAWTTAFGLPGSSPASLATVGTTLYAAVALTSELSTRWRSNPAAAWESDININTPRSSEFSLAIDASGGTHLTYHVFQSTQVGYAYKPAAGSWTLSTLDTMEKSGGTNELAVDAAGGVHVGYTVGTFGADHDVRYAYKPANGSWTITTISAADDAGSESSFVLMPSGAPHLTYYNRAALDLVHVYRCP